jgi:hypothetical protein
MNSLKNSWIALLLLCACTITSSVTKTCKITSGSTGEELASITVSEKEVTVKDKEGILVGVAKRSDKRKYYNTSNDMIYAVKMDDDGFKLRDSKEELLWKVKLYDDKLKIASNEEMTGAYEVKLRDGKLKLEKNDTEIKSIRLSENADSYPVNEQYTLDGFGMSLTAGIMMIPELSDREKFVIAAELVQRKR